jgi:glycosyltransferase involved in cell wall biosynthesis
MKFYAHYTPSSGCDLHRLMLPYRWMAEDFPEHDFNLSLTDPFGHFDYLTTHGCPPLGNVRSYGMWKRQGGRWVWSLDDDMLAVPDDNPAKLKDAELDLWYAARDLADVVLSSTPALTAAVGRPEKTVTAPNLMPVADYGVTEPAPHQPGEPLRVLWAGSKTHQGDLEQIEAAVDRLLRKWGWPAVEFVFVGFAPGRLLRDWLIRGVHFNPGVGLGNYPQLLNSIRPHVVLAPLKPIPFNLSKSNIRVLEGFSLAAAVVASPVGEYAVVEDGVTGLHATTADDWFHAVDRLLADRDYRDHLARSGRRRVRDFDWADRDAREPWRQAVRQLQSRLA